MGRWQQVPCSFCEVCATIVNDVSCEKFSVCEGVVALAQSFSVKKNKKKEEKM